MMVVLMPLLFLQSRLQSMKQVFEPSVSDTLVISEEARHRLDEDAYKTSLVHHERRSSAHL